MKGNERGSRLNFLGHISRLGLAFGLCIRTYTSTRKPRISVGWWENDSVFLVSGQWKFPHTVLERHVYASSYGMHK